MHYAIYVKLILILERQKVLKNVYNFIFTFPKWIFPFITRLNKNNNYVVVFKIHIFFQIYI